MLQRQRDIDRISQNIKIRSLTTSIWEFKKRIVKSLGRKHFDDNKKFTDSLRNSKIHISGYLSTTFGESITYDIPTLGLISKDVYDFSYQFIQIFYFFLYPGTNWVWHIFQYL